jgi:hypothetical protein
MVSTNICQATNKNDTYLRKATLETMKFRKLQADFPFSVASIIHNLLKASTILRWVLTWCTDNPTYCAPQPERKGILKCQHLLLHVLPMVGS